MLPGLAPAAFFGAGGISLYQIQRSLRFNHVDNSFLNRTPGVTGERRAFTFSTWIKRSALGNDTGTSHYVYEAYIDSSNYTIIYFHNTALDTFSVIHLTGGTTIMQKRTAAVLRDPSAWCHLVVAVDSRPATPTCDIYANGVLATSFLVNLVPAQNTLYHPNTAGTPNYIGVHGGAGTSISGYLAETHLIDGQALPATDFGQFDTVTGEWVPKPYTGAYGTNGFYLKYSDNSTTAALGTDYSGNGNNLTTTGFSVAAGLGNDSLVDSPTNYGTDTGVGGEVRGNYCTLNPLDAHALANLLLRNGGLEATAANTASWSSVRGTMPLITGGKWYWEVTPTIGAGSGVMVGIMAMSVNLAGLTSNYYFAQSTDGFAYNCADGLKYNNATSAAYGATVASGDVIGIAFDAAPIGAGTLTFYKNGVSQGVAFSSLGSIAYDFMPAVSVYQAPTTGAKADINFGQRPFAFTPPAGYKALCTQNIAAPPVIRGDDAFLARGRVGTGANYVVSGMRFLPNIVWAKDRNATNTHLLNDSLRGTGNSLTPNNASASVPGTDFVQSFNANGYNGGALGVINTSANALIDWMWKEGVPNGMDIIGYVGDATNRQISHNLGSAPLFMIFKSSSAATSWIIYHGKHSPTKYTTLDTPAAVATSATMFNNSSSNSSTFWLGTDAAVNANLQTFIAYVFANKPGFSHFWSYVGNGNANGPFVPCGFKPEFVMIKNEATVDGWWMMDGSRSIINPVVLRMTAEAADVEATIGGLDFLANGFKIRGTDAAINGSGQTMVYAAFAKSPFKYARARP